VTATIVAGLLQRDLAALRREIELYADEHDLWRTAPGVANPGGNLALHLTGNLQHFIGKVLGGTSFVRDRAAEFGKRDMPRAQLLAQVDAAIAAVRAAVPKITPQVWAADFPEPVGGFMVKTDEFVTHLAAHFAYHLGQLDYHRRLVSAKGDTAGCLPIGELRSARKMAT